MPHEGMVHALEEAHRLLRPSGRLIEIHPAREAPFVLVRLDGKVTFAEADPGYDYEVDLERAEDAVAAVLDRGMFVLDDSRRFELRTYAASVEELRDHFAVTGAYDLEDRDEALMRLRDAMYARAREALDHPALTKELLFVEPARMSRLTPSH
jgi:SAM-dependent methyltransferase